MRADFPFGVRVRRRLARLLSERLGFLLPDRHLPFPGADGTIYLDLHESRMMVERALRVYEYWTAAFMRSVLRPGMTAIDVGANKGDYTLLFARAVGGTGCVLSFEPDLENVSWLERAIRRNGYEWVRTLRYALAAQDGEATFYPGLKSGWGSLRSDRMGAPGRAPFDVATRRLDGVLAEQGIAPGDVQLVKVDVEGGELGVLKGAPGLLAAGAVTLVMDVDVVDPAERAEIHDLLLDAGMGIWAVGKTLRSVNDLAGVTTIVAAAGRDFSGWGR